MGSSNSRMGGSGHPPPVRPQQRRRRRRPSLKRSFSSLLVCGASSLPHNEIEGDQVELQSDVDRIMSPAKSCTLLTDSGNECSRHKAVISSENAICSVGNHSNEDVSRISETEKAIVDVSKENGRQTSNETTGVLADNDSSPEPVILDWNANVDAVDNRSGKMNEVASESGSSSDAVESSDDNEVLIFRECGFTSGSAPSESSLDCNLATSSSGVGSSVADMEEDHRHGTEIQIDRAMHSSNFMSINNASGLAIHGGRPSDRRLLWDSFSRRNIRRNSNPRTFVFGPDDTDSVGFHNGSLFDFSSDFFDFEVGGSSRFHRNNNHFISDQGLRSTSEVWERSHDLDGNDRRSAVCPIGFHPDGTCACSSIFSGEGSGPRANISRIVLLAEALFEVLDDAPQQAISLSMPNNARPAPEALVNSLPVRHYHDLGQTQGGDESPHCYICLAEYVEGDEIRILPCFHEFHMACVDKWLKEIHGVCPLCRGDVVREDSSKALISP